MSAEEILRDPALFARCELALPSRPGNGVPRVGDGGGWCSHRKGRTAQAADGGRAGGRCHDSDADATPVGHASAADATAEAARACAEQLPNVLQLCDEYTHRTEARDEVVEARHELGA